jgi:hypothetical protein
MRRGLTDRRKPVWVYRKRDKVPVSTLDKFMYLGYRKPTCCLWDWVSLTNVIVTV